MGHLNLLPDQDVRAIFTNRKGKRIFKKRFQILLVSQSRYLKQQCPRLFSFSVIFGKTDNKN